MTTEPPGGLLAGKVAIITGASAGIGAAAAEYFAKAGASVVLAARRGDLLAELAKRIEKDGGTALPVEVDVTDERSVARLVERTVERFGRLDAAVNNAGMNPSAPMSIDVYPMDEFRRIVDVKLMGTAFGVKYEMEAMKLTGAGAIVNHSSVVAFRGGGGLYPAASATQAAVVGLTKSAAAAGAPFGIRVNALAIGAIDTGWSHKLSDEQRRERGEKVPLGRMGTGSEVAAQAAWLCSDQCGWTTGIVVPIEGGAMV
ncbi:MAG: SDR family NAD(P)-dependent oxidoreductase [Vicinamibacterales bacterium]